MKPLTGRLDGPFEVKEGESLTVALKSGKGWNCGKRGWLILGIQYADRLDEIDPPKDAYRVLTWMVRNLDNRNKICGWTMQRIGEQCSRPLTRQRVSEMLRLLRDNSFIQFRENESHVLYTHPQYMFHGSVVEQRVATKEWNAYAAAHPLVVVVPDDSVATG